MNVSNQGRRNKIYWLDFFVGFCICGTFQLLLISFSLILFFSYILILYGVFLFIQIGVIAFAVSLLLFFIKRLNLGYKLGAISASIPMLIYFVWTTFFGFKPHENMKDYPTQSVSFKEMPLKTQEFFKKWPNGNPKNLIGSNGYHLIGHYKKDSYDNLKHGYLRQILEGYYHVFHFPEKGVRLNAFVKNAFFVADDNFYYSSDFTNLLPIEMACYYKINISKLLHPPGYNTKHEFKPKYVKTGD